MSAASGTEYGPASLADRAALVTGGTRGIGRAVVERLAAEGADVVFGYNAGAADAIEVEAAVARHGRRCSSLSADLTEDDAPRRLVEHALERLGKLDVLVVNAAWWSPAPLLETPLETLDRTLAVNTRGTFLLVQAAGAEMARAGTGGRIIVLTSRAARRPRPGTAAYSVSKAAASALVRAAAVELAAHGITVNEIAPGPTETDMNEALRADPVARRALLDFILLGRFGKPSDVAAAVAFLASDEAAFITGCRLSVDGGASIG